MRWINNKSIKFDINNKTMLLKDRNNKIMEIKIIYNVNNENKIDSKA